MPSVSKKQHNFMAAVANNPAFAKKAGIPQRVGADFMKADVGRKFAKGGDMKESKEMMKKEVAFMKKKGAPKSMIKHEEKEAKGYAKGGGCEMKGETKAFGIGGMMRGAARKAMADKKPLPAVGMAPRRSGMLGNMVEQVRQRGAPMPQQRGGLSNISPEAKSKIGNALSKMMGGVRSSGARAMTSQAPVATPDMASEQPYVAKKGGSVKTFAKGGGCELKGKTKGRII